MPPAQAAVVRSRSRLKSIFLVYIVPPRVHALNVLQTNPRVSAVSAGERGLLESSIFQRPHPCIPESPATINVSGPTRGWMFDPRARRVYHAGCSRVYSTNLQNHVRKTAKYGIGHQTCTRHDVLRCRAMAECLWRSTHAERYSN